MHIENLVICQSSALNDALGDLDKSCDRITFKFSPESPQFYLKGESDQGMYEVSYALHSNHDDNDTF